MADARSYRSEKTRTTRTRTQVLTDLSTSHPNACGEAFSKVSKKALFDPFTDRPYCNVFSEEVLGALKRRSGCLWERVCTECKDVSMTCRLGDQCPSAKKRLEGGMLRRSRTSCVDWCSVFGLKTHRSISSYAIGRITRDLQQLEESGKPIRKQEFTNVLAKNGLIWLSHEQMDDIFYTVAQDDSALNASNWHGFVQNPRPRKPAARAPAPVAPTDISGPVLKQPAGPVLKQPVSEDAGLPCLPREMTPSSSSVSALESEADVGVRNYRRQNAKCDDTLENMLRVADARAEVRCGGESEHTATENAQKQGDTGDGGTRKEETDYDEVNEEPFTEDTIVGGCHNERRGAGGHVDDGRLVRTDVDERTLAEDAPSIPDESLSMDWPETPRQLEQVGESTDAGEAGKREEEKATKTEGRKDKPESTKVDASVKDEESTTAETVQKSDGQREGAELTQKDEGMTINARTMSGKLMAGEERKKAEAQKEVETPKIVEESIKS